MFRLTRRELVQRSALAGAASLLPWRTPLAAGQAALRVLSTTDVHVHIHPYDYYRDREEYTVGLAKISTLVEAARAGAANSLLLDNGDFIQGNPLGDFMAYERGLEEGDLHPMIAAMNSLGYDAATLGNHEFNYGLSFLDKAMARAGFPSPLANVLRGTSGEETLFAPYAILEREIVDDAGTAHAIKIGVIGFTPPQIMIWDKAHLEGNARSLDIVASAERYVPEMLEQGCDLIVALSHSGIAGGAHSDGAENASLALAGVDGIDLVITGHHRPTLH